MSGKSNSIMNSLALITAGVGLFYLSKKPRKQPVSLEGQVALITGGSRGLGLAIAEELNQQRVRLALCARDEQELEQARDLLSQAGAEVITIRCDLTDRDQVQRMVEQVTSRFGGIDMLVNNAGIISVGPVQTQTVEDFEASMDNIFWATFNATNAVLPQMLERKSGRIVNISSIGGMVSVPHLLTYSSAKFAVQGFSEGLRAELAKEGIIVTTVAPGLMRTGSQINTIMKGSKHQAEYTWFTLMDALPITSIAVKRAAKQIVNAAGRGRAILVITTQAQLLARFHGLFPGLTTNILSIVNRFLPSGEGAGTDDHLGKESETPVTQSFLTGLGQRAARTYNEEGL